jgi:ABC-2 type transport system ATP-binding protein
MIDDAPFAIETTRLTKRYGSTCAVDDLELRIPQGATFGFIGPNGAGKTTTIRMLMGMLRPTAGAARVLGIDVIRSPAAMKQRVGYVPELHHIYRWMRVDEAIRFCRRLYAAWNDRLCDELLALFELEPRKKVSQLSKGMVANLGLLLALAHEPDVLILDEPTSGLDPIVREEFLDGVLRAVCDRDRTVLFSSHTLSDVQRVADRIGIICNGKLLVCCAADELLATTKRLRVVLRDGKQPKAPPRGVVWQRQERREWLLTVRDFSPDVVEQIRHDNAVDSLEVIDLGLEDLFKDFVRGVRAS